MERNLRPSQTASAESRFSLEDLRRRSIDPTAHECKKKKRDEQAHTAQADEGDEALLVVDACIDVAPVEDNVVTQSSDVTSGVTAPPEVHLNENKLFVQLGDKGCPTPGGCWTRARRTT
jgi:hypothetical protein